MELQQIVIKYYQENKSQRQIARELSISRNRVKKYITLHNYEKNRICEPPKYNASNRRKRKLTDALKHFIDLQLQKNKERKQNGFHKQCLSNKAIHELVLEAGFSISYVIVSRYISAQNSLQRDIFIKQQYKPGMLAEFDWGHVRLKINGQIIQFKMAVITLAYSNYRWAKLYNDEKTESFINAHNSFFYCIGGVPSHMVYDNMKVAVAKFSCKQKDKVATEQLIKLSTYYTFKYRFTNPRKGNEKGHVEQSVKHVRQNCFTKKIDFDSLDHANAYLIDQLNILNSKKLTGSDKSINVLKAQEQNHFTILPPKAYKYIIEKSFRVDKLNTISINTNRYSIPDTYKQKTVIVKIYYDIIEIYDFKYNLITRHQRCHSKCKWIFNLNHYLLTLRKKPGALQCSYALNQSPDSLQNLFHSHYSNSPKTFIELAIYCKENRIDIAKWIKATQHYTKQTNNQVSTEAIICSILQLKQEYELLPPFLAQKNEAKSEFSAALLKQAEQQLENANQFINKN